MRESHLDGKGEMRLSLHIYDFLDELCLRVDIPGLAAVSTIPVITRLEQFYPMATSTLNHFGEWNRVVQERFTD